MYHNNTFQVSMIESTTATTCVHIIPKKLPDNGYNDLTIFYHNDDQLKFELTSLLQQGYFFTSENVKRACSIHQLKLKEVKSILINNIIMQNPTPYDIQQVILLCGIALNLQIDKNPIIFNNQSICDNINHKLSELQLENDEPKLFRKYSNLNKFYNATKHNKTIRNRNDETMLNSPLGKEIAIDFFETVIKIFYWYYKKHVNSVPDWDELQSIDYSKYNFNYSFSYDRLY